MTTSRWSRRAILILPFALAGVRVSAVPQSKAIDAEDPDQLTPLMRSSARGDLKSVAALLEKGADPDVRNTEHRLTAVMFAAYFGHAEIVNALIAKGATVSFKDALGAEAVDWAILGGHPAVAKIFIAKGSRENPFLTLGSMPFWLMDKAAGK